MLWLIITLGACKKNAGEEAEAEPSGPLSLDVSNPTHGAFLGDVAKTKVKGSLTGGASPDLVVGRDAVPLDKTRAFVAELPVHPGVNIIPLEATDAEGHVAEDAVAVHAGPTNPPGAVLEDAIRMQLGAQFLDDNNDDLDDLAGVAKAFVSDPSLLQKAVGTSFDTGGYGLLGVDDIDFADVDVDISPQTGKLIVKATVQDLWVDFNFEGEGILFWYDTTGSAYADTAEITLVVVPTSSGRGPGLAVSETSTAFVGFGMSVDNFPDGFEDELAEWVQGMIEEKVTEQLSDVVAPLLSETVNALAFEFDVMDMTFGITVGELWLEPEGLMIAADAWSEANVPPSSYPSGAGSLRTPDAPPAWPLSQEKGLAIAIDDDLLNQLLFSAWGAGIMQGALDFAMPEPFGPADGVTFSIGMPPSLLTPVTATRNDLPSNGAQVGVGEITLDFPRPSGEVLSVALGAQLGVALVWDEEEGTISFDLIDEAEEIGLAAAIRKAPAGEDTAAMPARAEELFVQLFPVVGGFLPELPVPNIGLGTITNEDPRFVDKAISFRDPEIFFGTEGWLHLEGNAGLVTVEPTE